MGLTRDDLRVLLEAFEASTWQEMTVEVGGDRIHVSRQEAAEHTPRPPSPSNGQTPAPVPETPAPSVVQVTPTVSATGTPVVSPSVGLFWRAPSPDSPPFVDVGSQVGPDDTIGIVEVMKLMTPVAAGRAGTVSAVLADNGAMIEHGQTLVLIAE
jgi:acetyl-CoA carboxylase biotin carboxyl carrier protein